MVVLTTEVCGEEKPLYMDGGLHEQLIKKVIPSVQKKDFDWFVIVDGEEGSGKSVFGFQIAKVIDPNFTHEQIAFTSNDFIRLVIKAKKNQCIVFDEAFTGLSSRTALSEINNMLVSLMMEMRQKNLFIILIMPSFFMLDKYCVLHRSKGLFHVYIQHGKRGFWHFYNRKRTKLLYLMGKKFYDYSKPKPIIFGRFQDQYMIDKKPYIDTKIKALHSKKRSTRAEVYKMQRDTLFWVCYHEYKKSQTSIAEMCKKWDYKVDQAGISLIIKEKRSKVMIEEAIAEQPIVKDIIKHNNTPNIG